MNNIEPRWIKKIIIAIVLGFISGEIISKLLSLVLIDSKWDLLLSLFVPLFIVAGLIYVLMQYTKEKDDMLNGNK